MAKEIVKTKDGKELPSTKFQNFALAISTLEDIDEELSVLEAKAKDMKVTDAESYRQLAEIVAQSKQFDKSVDKTVEPFEAVIETVKAFISDQKNMVMGRAARIRNNANPVLAEYVRAENAAKEMEQAKERRALEDRLKREAEVKRQAEEKEAVERRKIRVAEIRSDFKAGKITKRQSEKLLREAGATEEADKARAAAEADEAEAAASEKAAKLKVESNVPSVEGISKRTYYKFKVVKPQAVKLKYLKPDEVEIGKVVYSCKGKMREAEIEVGGIEVFEDNKF